MSSSLEGKCDLKLSKCLNYLPFGGMCHMFKNCVILMTVAYPLHSTSTKISKHSKLSPQLLHKLGSKNCPKLTEYMSFFKFPEILLFGGMSKL